MRISIQKSYSVSRVRSILVRIASILIALLSVGALFVANGIDPAYGYSTIVFGTLGTTYGISEILVKAIPIGLCALGLSIAYTAKVMNVGSDGQLVMGAIFATWIALFSGFPSFLTIPAMFLAGFIGGALWGFIPGILKSRYNVNETIVSLMMNYVSLRLLDYLLSGPWRGQRQLNYPITDEFPDFARLSLIEGTRIHYLTVLVLVILALIILFVMRKTKLGFELKAMGDNPNAARIAGVDIGKGALIVMLVSGGLAGLAGVGEVAGIYFRLTRNVSPGYGYSAIIPAWIGGFDPIIVLVSSLFVSSLFVGGNIAKLSLNMSYGLVNALNGIVLLFMISSEYFLGYRVRIEWT